MEVTTYFGSHMVVQRDVVIPLSGKDIKGQLIKVNFLGKSYETYAGESGSWEVLLEPATAGGPYSMEILGSSRLVLEDLMVGDVYLLGGQSNMELRIMDTLDAIDQMTLKDHDSNIRYMRVIPKYDFKTPDEDVLTKGWQVVDPKSILEISAVGYFFAKEIRKNVDIPIGLVNTAVGGSCIEAWMAPDTLKAYENIEHVISLYETKEKLNRIIKSQEEKKEQWRAAIHEEIPSMLHEVFGMSNLDDKSWAVYAFPSLLDAVCEEPYQGSIWLVKDFILTEQPTGEALLRMGLMIDTDKVWINGKATGSGENRYQMRRYPVPEGVLKQGINRILVQLTIENGKGGFVPKMPYYLQTQNEIISLSGDWRWKKGIAKEVPSPEVLFPPLLPIGLYHGVMVPLSKMVFKAVLWYQGESNTGHEEDYSQLFKSMKEDWEKLFQRSLIFCCVQLPGYQEPLDTYREHGWAMLREYQRRCRHDPDCGVITTIDLGENYDLHPQHKEELARRLSLWVRKFIYNQNVVCSGPILERYICKGKHIVLFFMNDDNDKEMMVPFFEVSKNGTDFQTVGAVHQKGRVILFIDEIAKAVRLVRYAWQDAPQAINYYNQEGLPAEPFLLEIGG